MTKTILLSTTEVALAQKLGITPQEYAKQRSLYAQQSPNWPLPEDEQDDPNKDDVMNIPVKTMKELWLTKFGYRWVCADELDKQEMDEWSRIEGRLQEYNLLENYDNWYKMKEDL